MGVLVGKLGYQRCVYQREVEGRMLIDEDLLLGGPTRFDGQEKICIKRLSDKGGGLWVATYIFGLPTALGGRNDVYNGMIEDGWSVGQVVGKDCRSVKELMRCIAYGEAFTELCVKPEAFAEGVAAFLVSAKCESDKRLLELEKLVAEIEEAPGALGMSTAAVRKLEIKLLDAMRFSKMPSVGVEL